jgi:hypothetical protein
VEHARPGQPRQPNGWGDYHPADYDQYHDEDNWSDDYGETAGGDEPDPWGDTYPDAAYPADSNNHTRRDDAHEPPSPATPPPTAALTTASPTSPQPRRRTARTSCRPSRSGFMPWKPRTPMPGTRSQICRRRTPLHNQQIADLKADKDELTARLDLIEQHPASNDGYQDRETRRPDHGADGPDGPREENRTRCSTSA